jgi:hypothetical protein
LTRDDLIADDTSSTGNKDDDDDDEDDDGADDKFDNVGDPERLKAFNVSTFVKLCSFCTCDLLYIGTIP